MGGNHVCPCLPACHPAHVSCHRQHTAPEESGGSSRAEGAGISLGLAAEAQPQRPPRVPLEQAQTGSSCQSRDKSLNHPNPRLLCYPKPSPPTADTSGSANNSTFSLESIYTLSSQLYPSFLLPFILRFLREQEYFYSHLTN